MDDELGNQTRVRTYNFVVILNKMTTINTCFVIHVFKKELYKNFIRKWMKIYFHLNICFTPFLLVGPSQVSAWLRLASHIHVADVFRRCTFAVVSL